MPFLITLLVIALIVAFLFLSTLFIVPQQQAYIIDVSASSTRCSSPAFIFESRSWTASP